MRGSMSRVPCGRRAGSALRCILVCIALGAVLLAGCPLPPSQRPLPPSQRPLLPAPGGTVAEAVSSTSIRVYWSIVEGAEGYNLHRSGSREGAFARIHTAGAAESSYEDGGLAANTLYWYKVAALRDGQEQALSAAFSGVTSLDVPGGVVANAVAPGEIEMTWNPVAGAEGYNVYRSASADGWYEKKNTTPVTSPSYTDRGLSPRTCYWYRVAALKGGLEQERGAPVSCVSMLGPPLNVHVSFISGGALRVGWDALPDAEAYNVYRGETQTGVFTRLNAAPVTAFTFDDTGLVGGTISWYKVSGIRAGVEQALSDGSRGLTAQVWARTYGGPLDERAYSIQQTADGGYIVAGTADSFTYYLGTSWLLKLDEAGSPSWQKTYDGSRVLSVVRQTTDGGFIVGGRALDSWSTYDFMVTKLDSYGWVSWQKSFGRSTPGNDYLYTLRETSDGGCIVAGTTVSQLLVLKLSSDGLTQWGKSYGSVASYANAVLETSDGGYVVAGSTTASGAGLSDGWVLKLDPVGSVSWQKTYGGPGSDGASEMKQTSDGGYIIVGCLNGQNWLLKLDSSGGVSWQKVFSGVGDWSYTRYAVDQTADGGYIVASYVASVGVGGTDLWVVKTDAVGTIAWQRAYRGSNGSQPVSIEQASDGGYIVGATTKSYGAGGADYWIIKLPVSGILEGAAFVSDTAVAAVDGDATVADTSFVAGTVSLAGINRTPTASDTSATLMWQYP